MPNPQLPTVPPTATYSSLMVEPCPWDKTKVIFYATVGGQCFDPIEVYRTFDVTAYASQYQFVHLPAFMEVAA